MPAPENEFNLILKQPRIAMMAPLLEILQWPESGFFGEGQVRQFLPLDATAICL